MKITVYIPVYNGAKYIETQLESIRTQTRRVDAVYMRDDGSTDGTRALIAAYIHRHCLTDWHLLQDHAHLGLNGGHRALWAQEHGDLVFVADQDDIWMPQKVEWMAELMEQQPALSLLVGGYGYCDADAQPIWHKKWDTANGSLEALPLTDFLPYSSQPGCSFCVRGAVIATARELGSPDCAQSLGQDWFLLVLACIIGEVAKLHRITFLHRMHASNASRERARSATLQSATPTLRLFRWKQAAAAHRWFLTRSAISEKLTEKQRILLAKNAAYTEKRVRLQETKSPLLALSLLFDCRAFLQTPRSLRRRLRDFAADLSYAYGINPQHWRRK